MGCDIRWRIFYQCDPIFQSTHPHGVRRHPLYSSGGSVLFQSTHPHGVRLSSINSISPFSYFNPRTRMGCDRPPLAATKRGQKFQSTHPHGVRHPAAIYCDKRREISIHAPAWGATAFPRGGYASNGDFNPRTRMGCDPMPFGSPYLPNVFQSTHPHGVRLYRYHQCCLRIPISIHAPAWGATRCVAYLDPKEGTISIHAPAWGATRS